MKLRVVEKFNQSRIDNLCYDEEKECLDAQIALDEISRWLLPDSYRYEHLDDDQRNKQVVCEIEKMYRSSNVSDFDMNSFEREQDE